MEKISVVINTINEAKNLPRVLSSIKTIASEIVVVDMKSDDETQATAKSYGARVFEYKRVGYVEPARNYALSKATGDWILILDADEELPLSLAKKLKEIVKKPKADFYRIPRKNIIFGKWMKHSGWWPDANIRFFKRGKVVWNEIIHSVPVTTGVGRDLEEVEENAIIHYHYNSVEGYVERLNRYSGIQSEEIVKSGYRFIWKDLVRKPTSEFLSRYFAREGYKDGVHGLALAGLQAFSEFVLYLKIWQKDKFMDQAITPREIGTEFKNSLSQFNWWIYDMKIKSKGFFESFPLRIIRRIRKINE